MPRGPIAARRSTGCGRSAVVARTPFAHRAIPRCVEPLEPRRLLSVAPAAPDLLPASDSGVSDADDVTNFNDAGAERALRFAVRGTLPGATVTLLADGNPVATATATSDETLLRTPGTLALASGSYSFTARQALAGEPKAPASPPTVVTIDTVAPPRQGTPDLRPASDRGVSDRDNVTNDRTPTLDLPLAGALYYRLLHNGVPFAATNPYTATDLVDGVHTFVLEGVDAAGNVSEPSEALRITLDTVAPPAGWFAGTADRTFDNNGRASLSSGEGDSVAVQPDGRILVAGATLAGVMVISRLNPDGSPDVSFGDRGHVEIPGSYLTHVGVQPDGGVIVAGSSEVFRLTATGQRDPGFGNGGIARAVATISDLTVDAAGRVLLVGNSNAGHGTVMRLTPDGARDATFGRDGVVPVAAGALGIGEGYSVAAAPDGKVLVAGLAVPSLPVNGETQMFVLRLDPDGTPDETFGTGGGHVLHRVSGSSEAFTVMIQPDGKLLVGGTAYDRPGGYESVFIARLAPDGALDPTFGGTGFRLVPGYSGRAVALPGGDSFLVTSRGQDIALVHFDRDGRLNPALPDGAVLTPSGAGLVLISGYAVEPDGDVLLVGFVYGASTRRITVWRMHGTTAGVPDLQAASDSGVSNEDNVTNDATPTFDLTAPPTAPPDVYVRLYRDGVLVSRHERPGPYTAPPQPDGTWDYATGVIDVAGNESIGSAVRVTIDTVAPPAGWLAGTADASFDNNGRATLSSGGAPSLAVQPDGKLLVGGHAGGVMVISRLQPDGAPDVSFGDRGRVEIPGNYGFVGVQPDGGVVVAGPSQVFRLTAGGQRDFDFGNGGSARVDSLIRDLAVDAAGRVLLLANDHDTTGGVTVVRLTPDGARDPAFGGTGQVILPPGPGDGYGISIVAAPDGKVLVGGYAWLGEERMFVLRLDPDGSPDRTFGAGRGYVQHAAIGRSAAMSVTVQADGKILVGGDVPESLGTGTRSFIARLAPDGALDRAFGGTGFRIVPGHRGLAAALPGGDSFLITSRGQDIALVHFDRDGRLDPALPDGTAVTPSGASLVTITDHAVQPNGDVLLVGIVYSTGRITVWRMHGRTEGLPDLHSASDTGASATDNITNDATPTFNLAAPSSAPPGVYLRLYRNGVLVSGYERPGAVTAPPQPDGAWDYAAGVIDAAGNESIGPAISVTIDTAAPQVTAAFVGSMFWGHGTLSALQSAGLGGPNGYALDISDGPGAPLPWTNLNRLTLRVSEPLTLRSDDLRVHGVNVPSHSVSAYSADASRTALSWTMARPLPGDRLLLSFADTATDAAGNKVRFGTSQVLRIDVLPGDVNRSGAVTPVDYAQTRARLGAGPGAGTGPRDYSVLHDLNGSGRIDTADVMAARARLLHRLPPGEPTLPPASTSSPFSMERVIHALLEQEGQALL